MSVATGLVEAGRSIILEADPAAAAAADGSPATETAAVSGEIRLPNRQGLHARPAATVAAAAKGFRADVRLLRGADSANAKSVTAILLLATRPNDAIRVSASGPDAAAAVSALAALLAAGSGESGATAEAASGPARGAPVTAVPVAGSVPAAAPAPAPAEGPTRSTDPRKLLGVSASPGLVLGKVAQLRRASIHVEERGAGIERERAHLDVALERARQQVEAPRAANSGAASKILDAHLELLADPELIDLAVAGLADGRSGAYAWREAYSSYATRLESLASSLLRERAGDVRDVGGRVLGLLAGVPTAPIECAPGSIPTDGHRIEVAANIGTVEEALAAVAQGGEGVGLLRSELLFLDRDTAPSEEEQADVYRAVATALGRDRRLVIRTLDVGGDKRLPYLPLPPEENPFLGVRGIRTSLERPDLLRSQLRAILEAAPLGDVHVMFPMIASLDELRAARRILDEEQRGAGVSVRVGVMIEVPSAALTAGQLAREVDFFSIGTNDLTQYTLAMDRGHPKLAPLADALHPAVLKLISLTVEGAHAHGKWVGVCGGLAAEPVAVPVLLGMGVDELSVPVPAIAAVKALVRRLALRDCQALARELLGLATAGEVRARLARLGSEAGATAAAARR